MLILFYLAIVCLHVLYTQAKFRSETFDPVLYHNGDFVLVMIKERFCILSLVTLCSEVVHRASETVQRVKVLLHKPESPGFVHRASETVQQVRYYYTSLRTIIKILRKNQLVPQSCPVIFVCTIAFAGPY